MAEKVEIKIIVDKQTGAIKVAEQELKGLGQAVNDTNDKTKSLTGSMGGLAGQLASIASTGAIIAFFKSAITASIEQEDAVNRLNEALAKNGRFTQETSRSLQEYANQLQATTKFSDEAVIGAGSLFATFGQNEEQIKKSTQAAADLATVMGTDLQSASQLLSKAFQGQEGALGRLGIKIDESVPAAQRYEAILAGIADKMGGRAQADAESFSGTLVKLKNAFGDIAEEIGDNLIPTLDDFARKASENLNAVRDAVAGILFAFKTMAASAELIINTMTAPIRTLGQVIGQIAGAVALLIEGKAAEAGKAFLGVKDVILGNAKGVAVDLFAKIAQVEKAYDDTIGRRIAGETLAAARVRQVRNETAEHEKTLTDQEKKQAEDTAKFKTGVIEKQLQNELALKNKSSSEKIAAINNAEFQEASIQLALMDQKVITEQEFNNRMLTLHEEFTGRRQAINNKYQEDVTAANEAWFSQATNLYARFNELGRKTLDSFTQGIGDAFAKQILHGKNFAESFNTLWNNIKEQVISAITAMIAKLIALRIAQAAVGFGTGGVGGGLLSKVFAKGGRTPALTGIRKLAGGARTSGPELALIGEGRDDETVVPDGQARGFAMGVMAGKNGPSAPASKSAPVSDGGKVVNATINITINSIDMSDKAVTQRLARDLADMVLNETEEGIRLSRRIGDVNERFQGRSV